MTPTDEPPTADPGWRRLAGPSGWAPTMAWCGAVVDCVCGVALLLAAASLLAEPAAGVVFGLLTAPLGLVLTVPLVLCVRRARAT